MKISTAVVTIGDATFDPIEFSVSADNDWSPAWTGTVTLPTAGVPALDPTTYPKARVQWWWGDIDAPNLILDVMLTIRTVDEDEIGDTTTLKLMTDEIRLRDYKNAAVADYQPGAISLRAMFIYAMGKLGITSYNAGNIPTSILPAASTVWKAGDSLDDWLRPVTRTAGLELYQDPYGGTATMLAWDMNLVGKSQMFGSAGAAYGVNILDAHTVRDMDDDTWADAVTATYTWTDAAGASHTKTYAAVPAGAYHKVLAASYSAADPGVNPAPSMLARAKRSGFSTPLTILPTPVTGQSIQTHPMQLGDFMTHQLRDGSIYSSNVVNMRFSYPADTMQLGLANVVAGGTLPTIII